MDINEEKELEKKLAAIKKEKNSFVPQKNILGSEINFDETLEDVITFDYASFGRRFLAVIIDLALIISIWALFNVSNFESFYGYVAGLDPDTIPSTPTDEFMTMYYQFFTFLILSWILSVVIYHVLFPALIGKGKTMGKLVCSIGVVNNKDLRPIGVGKLFLRELVGRSLIEYLFAVPFVMNLIVGFQNFEGLQLMTTVIICGLGLIPLVISSIVSFVRKDSRSLHDLIAGSVVISMVMFDDSSHDLDEEIIAEKTAKAEKREIKEQIKELGKGPKVNKKDPTSLEDISNYKRK